MPNSKSKGNRGELKICKILTDRFGIKFNRVPNSGAFGTTHTLQHDAQKVLSGDLIVPKNWQFAIEVKTGYDLDLIYLLSSKPSNDKKMFQGFCEQSSEDSSRTPGRIPMVVYTKDRREAIVAIPTNNHSRQEQIKQIMSKEGNKRFIIVSFDLEKFKKWNEWILFSLDDILLEKDSFFFDEEL
jgi:hypothetical protein